MKFPRILVHGIVMMLLASPAFALELQAAKQAGLVGETLSGYIAPVGAATGEVSALISEVNNKRRATYQQISSANGQPMSVVEKLAAEKIYEERLAPGEYYQDASGTWKRK